MTLPSMHLDPCTVLFVILISVVIDNVEESELVDTLGGRDNTEPISQLLLLEKLLCPIPAVSVIILLSPPRSGVDAVVLTNT
jgi:hypothetical protein